MTKPKEFQSVERCESCGSRILTGEQRASQWVMVRGNGSAEVLSDDPQVDGYEFYDAVDICIERMGYFFMPPGTYPNPPDPPFYLEADDTHEAFVGERSSALAYISLESKNWDDALEEATKALGIRLSEEKELLHEGWRAVYY